MSEVISFTTHAGNVLPLVARPVLPNTYNTPAYQANISTITYAIYNVTDGGAALTGSLTVADVMFAALQTPWDVDTTGYTFLWAPLHAAACAWPLANKTYRIVLTFTTTTSLEFKRVWEVETTDPSGVT